MKARQVRQHLKNTNRGTERGATQIEESVRRYGYGRSILTDKNEVTIAGNHVLEVAHASDVPVRVVETDGSELVVVKRTDLDLGDPEDKRAVELGIADNRTTQTGLEWDLDRIQAEIAEGADITPFFREDELLRELEKQEKKDDSFFIKLSVSRDQLEAFSTLRSAVEAKGGDVVAIVLGAMEKAA